MRNFKKQFPAHTARSAAGVGDWLGQHEVLPGFEISFKSTAPRQRYKTSQDQRDKGNSKRQTKIKPKTAKD
ncbi:MAG: hypothetical protein K2N56_07945 [Oscillospiraceae bacterium]|nr:hypothetical protein [Oscillospiraceae bacterium]